MPSGKFLDLHRHLPSTAFVLIVLIVFSGFAGAFLYAGIYNIGADAPHSKTVYMTLDKFRERAIKHHARNIDAPSDLGDPKRIASGASLYNEMCTACHLGPGLGTTEMSQGLYPPAPELARGTDHSAAEQFWIIKHGIKLSAMPAWGRSHSDKLIWDIVAFLGTLPKLSPEQYEAAVAAAPGGHDEMMKDMPGMMTPPSGEAAPHGPSGHPH